MYGISKIVSGVGLAFLLVPSTPLIWMGASNAINNAVSKARVEERKIALQEQEQTVRDGIKERQKTLDVASTAGAYTSYRDFKLIKSPTVSNIFWVKPRTAGA